MVIPVSIDIVFAVSIKYDLGEWIVKIFSLGRKGFFILLFENIKVAIFSCCVVDFVEKNGFYNWRDWINL